MSSEEETKKIADQNGIELLPLYDKLAKKLDVGSYHSDRSLSSLGSDDIDVGARAGDAKGKRRPRVQLIQVCICLIHIIVIFLFISLINNLQCSYCISDMISCIKCNANSYIVEKQ